MKDVTIKGLRIKLQLFIILCLISLSSINVYIGLILSFFIGLYLNELLLFNILGPLCKYLRDGASIRNDVRLGAAILLVSYWMIGFVFFLTTAKGELKNSFYMRMYFMAVVINNLTVRLELGKRVVLLFSILQIILYPLYIESSI